MQKKNNSEVNRRMKRKRNRRRLFGILVFILMLVYLPAIWNWLFSSNIEIGVVKTSDLELKTPIKGVLIRKEQLLTSPGEGIIIPAARYGDKVAAGQKLASFISSDMQSLVDNYRQMRLEILQRVVSGYENSTGPEREVWADAIESQIAKLTDDVNAGNYSDAGSVKGSIDSVLEARAQYMLDNAGTKDEYKSEKDELDRLQNNIDKSETVISAPGSGVVSYYCSGDEGEWLPESRNSVTVEAVDQALAKETSSEKWITPEEITTEQDRNFCKLVTNDEAWLAFYIPADQTKQVSTMFEKKKMSNVALELDVELNGINRRIPVTIEGFGENNGSYCMVIARMTEFIELTMDMRAVTGNLVIRSVSGMKVPLDSLFNRNNVDQTADIVIIHMNKAEFRRIRIIAEQDSYAIIGNLEGASEEQLVNTFDIYVTNPKNIEEGQVIDQ